MNTSFPSAASDFGTFLAGGKQPNTHSQLKGILAGLGCSKATAADSVSTGKTDFDAILADSPASPGGTTAGTDPTLSNQGQATAEIASLVSDPASTILASGFASLVTTTLHIKGIVTDHGSQMPSSNETVSPDITDGNPSAAGQTQTQTEPETTTANVTGQTAGAVVPDATAIAQVGTPTSPVKAVTPGPKVARQIKMLPGRGQSSHGRGWNPALIVHTGARGQVGTQKCPVSVAPSAAAPNDSAPITDPLAPLTPAMTGSVIAPIVTAGELPPVGVTADSESIPAITESASDLTIASVVASRALPAVAVADTATTLANATGEVSTGSSPQTGQWGLPNATLAPDLGAAPTETNTILPDLAVGELPVKDLTSAQPQTAAGEAQVASDVVETPVSANLVPPRVSIDPVLPIVATEVVVPSNDVVISPVDSVKEPSEITSGLTGQTESGQIAPELRRDVVETVAAMLTPFLASLPVIQPELAPVTSDGLTANPVAPGGTNAAASSTISIKIGTQPPFEFELPHAALAQTGPDDLSATPPATKAVGDGVTSIPAAVALPAVFAQLAEETQSLDFRIQLKAKIEAAWGQPTPPATDETATAQQTPVIGASGHTTMVSEKVQTGETGNLPVEVMIKMPGFGVMTAQIVASDKASDSLVKKPGVGLGRAEKNAADPGHVSVEAGQDNSATEKTFLSSAVQSVKSKSGNAGTDVADSDDTMPARFTSRRVTVDPLELPTRFSGREVQPILNESQNIALSSETPVAATPAPVLAHRAVETILNVVEAQRQSSANASSVNLHFKFGGDDLAVRVQMRGGEVLTQFLTDSAELRSAISSEWQTVAGQGVAAGLRMHDPVIMPTSAGTSNGFGSMAQGQNHAQQNTQEQHAQSAEVTHELRELRRGLPFVAPTDAPAPGSPVVQPSSRLLAAMA